MERVWSYSIMEIGMKVTIQMESLKVKETIIGVMAQSIRANLKMGSDLEQVFGNLVEKSMKGVTLTIRGMVTASILGEVVAFIKEISFKTFDMDMDKCTGIMSLFTKENGFKAHKMDRDKYGKEENLYKKVFINLAS